jgi:hypothetical protein
MAIWLSLLVAVSFAIAFLSSQASALTLTYTGVCSFNCEEEGLDVGAPMNGHVEIDDSGYSPDGYFGNSDLVDFSFDFGGISLDLAGTKAFSFGGPWEVVPGAGLRWYLDASAAEGRSELGPTISASGGPDDGFGMASFLGTCETDAEFSCQLAFRTAAQFEMRTPTAPVPLPAAGSLLAVSMLGLGVAGRRGRGRR